MALRPSNGEAFCPTLAIGHEGTAAPSLFLLDPNPSTFDVRGVKAMEAGNKRYT